MDGPDPSGLAPAGVNRVAVAMSPSTAGLTNTAGRCGPHRQVVASSPPLPPLYCSASSSSPAPPTQRRRSSVFLPKVNGSLPRSPTSAPRFFSLPHRAVAPDEAYFAKQVIACRDGSGSFPRSRLNDGYCDCADGTDEPGLCLHLSWICPNLTGDRE